MNSDEQKNIIKTKDIHFNEQVFQQLVNGFENAKKAQQEFDMTYMKTYPSVRQQIRMRITTPHLFGDLLRSNFLREVIYNQYEDEKKKRMKILRDNFFTSWYDLQWWSKKLNQDQQQFDAEKDKSSWFEKLFKAYRIFTNFGRVYQTFKSMYKAAKNSQGFRSLFGRSYNLYNEQDYRAFQTNLNKALIDSVDVVQAGLLTWFKPTVLSIRGLYLTQLQKLYDKFAWWLFKEIFWGNNWVDVIFSIAGYAITIAGFIWTGGASSAIAAGQLSYRIGKVSLLMKRVFGAFSKTKTAVRFANKGKNVHKMTTIGRWGRRAEAWGKRSIHSSGATKAMNRLDKARQRLNDSKWIKRAVSSPLKFYIMWGKFTDYQAVRGYFHRRTRLMYQGMRGQLTKWEYATDAVDDIIDGMKLLSNAGKQRYLSQKYHDNRVNKKFGLQMKMSDKEVKKYPFFTTLEKLQIFFNKLQKSGLGKIKFGNIFGLNSQWKRGGSMALIMSNLTGKKGDIISWHRGGKQLLLQFSDKQKISIVLDEDGKVDIVQVGEKAMYWQKAISNTQRQLAGRKNNVKVSGFQWRYSSVNTQYKRKMKISNGASIKFTGLSFGKELKQKMIENDKALLVLQNDKLDLYIHEKYILGQNFQDNFKSFTKYGQKQLSAEYELKKQCQLLLQIVIDKTSNDEGIQYDLEEAKKLYKQIIDKIDDLYFVQRQITYGKDGTSVVGYYQENRWRKKVEFSDKTKKQLRHLMNAGNVTQLRRIQKTVDARVKTQKYRENYKNQNGKYESVQRQRFITIQKRVRKANPDFGYTDYTIEEYSLSNSTMQALLNNGQKQGYIENGRYHSK